MNIPDSAKPSSPNDATKSSHIKTSKRRPWVAVVLAFFCVGLGHVYCGRLKLGILLFACWYLGTYAFVAVAVVLDIHLVGAVLALLGVLAIGFIVQLIWAARLALQLENRYQLRPWNHGGVYAAALIIAQFNLGSYPTRAYVVEAFKIPAMSMMPTLMIGDHIFVSKLTKQYERGDVVVYQRADDRAYYEGSVQSKDADPPMQSYVCRIVAIGGDTIEMKDDELYLNDIPVPRSLMAEHTYTLAGGTQTLNTVRYREKIGQKAFEILEMKDGYSDSFGPIQVPKDHVFVLGDNRDNANDSRYNGSIPIHHIQGRARVIWWSNKRPEGFQWDRFGKRVE